MKAARPAPRLLGRGWICRHRTYILTGTAQLLPNANQMPLNWRADCVLPAKFFTVHLGKFSAEKENLR